MSIESLGQHLISDTGPEAIVGSFGHGATGSDALLGLLADNAAEVFPAHEGEGHAGDLGIANGSSRLQSVLEELLGLDSRFGLHGGTDKIIGGLNILVWPVLAEGLKSSLDGRKMGVGRVGRVANDKDGVERSKNTCVPTRIVTCRFAG